MPVTNRITGLLLIKDIISSRIFAKIISNLVD